MYRVLGTMIHLTDILPLFHRREIQSKQKIERAILSALHSINQPEQKPPTAPPSS